MRAILGFLLFYARFGLSFTRIGLNWRQRKFQSFEHALAGQHVVVTGASGGIGAAVVAGCVAQGATVTAVARNPDKLALLQAAHADAVTACVCDLAETDAVRKLASDLSNGPAVDVLVNNVGVLLPEYEENSRGTDAQFATNLLNQFVLTESLKDNGGLATDAGIVMVASGGMYMAPLALPRIMAKSEEQHDGTTAYAIQKRAQVLLADYWQSRETGQRQWHVMHPGWVDTAGVQRSLPTFRKVLQRWLRNAVEGADTIVWLASQRPTAPRPVQIWFDRSLHKVHVYGFTRGGTDDGERLVALLRECAER